MNKKSADDIYNNAAASSMLCMPHIIGARLQIERYLSVQPKLRFDPIGAGYICLHEVSALLESLDILRRYLKSLNLELWDEKLKIKDSRNAIRHDTREEIDNQNNLKQRLKRAQNLNTSPEFIFNILFHGDGFTVGGHRLYLPDIYHYINSAERVVNAAALGIKITFKDDEAEGEK